MYADQTISGDTDLKLAPVIEDLRTNPAMIKPLSFSKTRNYFQPDIMFLVCLCMGFLG